MSAPRPNTQSGNMLIYILGAILLLGLLIMLTKGNMQPGAGIDTEQSTIKVTEVRKYGLELERAVNFVLQNNNISEADIRFANAADTAYGTVGDTPMRQVFDMAGGGAEYKQPPTGIQTSVAPWFFSGVNAVSLVGSTCTQSTCADLIAFLPNVTKDFCIQLNNSVGITNPLGIPPKEGGSVNLATKFAGTFAYAQTLDTASGYTSGKPEGCFEGNSGSATTGLTGSYYYYRVLLAR